MTKAEFTELIMSFNETFCSLFLQIKTKAAEIIPFIFNEPQKKIYKAFQQRVREGKSLRFVILKARQEGISTFFVAVLFFRAITNFNWKSLIVGNEVKSANNLFEMIKRFYDNLPHSLQPVLEASNEKKLAFSKLKSSINVASADAGESLQRSDTIQDLICTEVAFWRDAKSALVALLQTIGDDSKKLVVLESTANGVGGEFHDIYQDAKTGKNDFCPIFIAWFELSEYARSFGGVQEKDLFAASLTQAEKSLQSIYNLTLEQLHWRRWAIENLCGGDLDQFKQEYPCNDIEAFLVSGRPVFDAEKCHRRIDELHDYEVYRVGDLVYTNEQKTEVEFCENKRGFVKLLYPINIVKGDSFRFVAGCDVAEGLEQGDFSVIKVLDRKTNEVCLTWHGHIHPDLLAEEQHKIDLFLGGDVWFNTERNNHGLTTISIAYQKGLRQFYEKSYTKGHEESTDKLGFRTTAATKPLLINAFVPALRDDLFIDNEKEFWQECSTFVRNEHGQMQAQGKDSDPATKCFDDRVIASALMFKCHQWLPPYSMWKTPRQYATEAEYMQATVFDKIKQKSMQRGQRGEAI